MTQRHAMQALLFAAGLSLLLFLLPHVVPSLWWVAWPVMLLSTLFHELGHGVFALLVGGGFDALRIHADGSGVATTLSDGTRTMVAAIAAGGPLGPPLVAGLLFVAASHPTPARVALWLLCVALGLAVPLWVRNVFGIGYVCVLVAILALIALRGSARAIQVTICFLAIELSLAAFSRGDYLFTAQASTAIGRMPSDTAQIASALWLPYWFWGGAIALLSLAILAAGMVAFARALRAGPPLPAPAIRD